MYITTYSSPLGAIKISGTEAGILSVDFVDRSVGGSPDTPPVLQECVRQLDEYFHAGRKQFTLSLLLEGTDFEKSVWHELLKIPYGQTCSYTDIAVRIGNLKAVRAVGMANGHNKIAIIVPCHRVIGSNGSLTGYAGGVWRKKWLLEHERGASQPTLF